MGWRRSAACSQSSYYKTVNRLDQIPAGVTAMRRVFLPARGISPSAQGAPIFLRKCNNTKASISKRRPIKSNQCQSLCNETSTHFTSTMNQTVLALALLITAATLFAITLLIFRISLYESRTANKRSLRTRFSDNWVFILEAALRATASVLRKPAQKKTAKSLRHSHLRLTNSHRRAPPGKEKPQAEE